MLRPCNLIPKYLTDKIKNAAHLPTSEAKVAVAAATAAEPMPNKSGRTQGMREVSALSSLSFSTSGGSSYGDDDNVCIQTTLGQLNFFRWALQYKILDYIEDNFDCIDADMNFRNSSSKNRTSKSKAAKTRKKRKELSVSATKSIKKEEVEIIVKFD